MGAAVTAERRRCDRYHRPVRRDPTRSTDTRHSFFRLRVQWSDEELSRWRMWCEVARTVAPPCLVIVMCT